MCELKSALMLQERTREREVKVHFCAQREVGDLD